MDSKPMPSFLCLLLQSIPTYSVIKLGVIQQTLKFKAHPFYANTTESASPLSLCSPGSTTTTTPRRTTPLCLLCKMLPVAAQAVNSNKYTPHLIQLFKL